MSHKSTTSLKLHRQTPPETQPPRTMESRAVRDLCHIFERTTGWSLLIREAARNNEPKFRLEASSSGEPSLARSAAMALAVAICDVVDELGQAKHGVWEREAELAAGVPITARPQEESHLAERLETVLRGGAEAAGCQAAALYLLDDSTTKLKLRACWGLPHERLLAPARPLNGAIADLEALVGHAVVLEDTSLLPHWRVPEDFAAALCVPVSSATNPLGTLWLFSDNTRDFTTRETNLVEIVAGRIAADLEREMLLNEGVQSKRVNLQWTSAAAWQQQRLPKVGPLVEGWQVAGWTMQADGVGGDFYDWLVQDDGRLTIALGDAHGAMLQAGFTAAMTQSIFRAHGQYQNHPIDLMAHINDTLLTCSAGDDFASLLLGTLQPRTGELALSIAGCATALLVGERDMEILGTDALPLGAAPETSFPVWNRSLQLGDTLVAMSEGIREARDRGGLRLGEASLGSIVRRCSHRSAQETAEKLRELIEHHCPPRAGLDRTVLVLKRKS